MGNEWFHLLIEFNGTTYTIIDKDKKEIEDISNKINSDESINIDNKFIKYVYGNKIVIGKSKENMEKMRHNALMNNLTNSTEHIPIFDEGIITDKEYCIDVTNEFIRI